MNHGLLVQEVNHGKHNLPVLDVNQRKHDLPVIDVNRRNHGLPVQEANQMNPPPDRLPLTCSNIKVILQQKQKT